MAQGTFLVARALVTQPGSSEAFLRRGGSGACALMAQGTLLVAQALVTHLAETRLLRRCVCALLAPGTFMVARALVTQSGSSEAILRRGGCALLAQGTFMVNNGHATLLVMLMVTCCAPVTAWSAQETRLSRW